MVEKKNVSDVAGKTSYYKNVVNNIIRLACLQVQGVASLTRGNSSGMRKMLTRKYQDGVLVENDSGGLFIDVYISVHYGAKVPEVSYKIQHSITESVETTTEYKVAKVNVHVTGVVFETEKPKAGDNNADNIPQYSLEEKN